MLAQLVTLQVPWEHVQVFQVDERVAPDGDAARNLGLLDSLPISPGQLLAMPVTAPDLHGAARCYADRLPARLDVVHLGMGDDGHTASWAPGDQVIDTTEPVALSGVYQGHRRMTLTPRVVNAAHWRIVLVAGESKGPAVARWLLRDSGVPIHRVRRTDTVVVLDAAAAARLPRLDG